MTSWHISSPSTPPSSTSSSLSFFADSHSSHGIPANLFASLHSRPSPLTLDPSLFTSTTTSSLSPSAPLPDPYALPSDPYATDPYVPSDDPFDLLSAIAGPLPLSSPAKGVKPYAPSSPSPASLPSCTSTPSSLPPPFSVASSSAGAAHHRSLSNLLSSSTSSPILLSSLFPSTSVPLTSSTPPTLRPRSLEGGKGGRSCDSSPLSTVTSFDFLSGSASSGDLLDPTFAFFDPTPHLPEPTLDSSEQPSFFSPIFWQTHPPHPDGAGRHHRSATLSTVSTQSNSSAGSGGVSQPSSPPYGRSRSNSNSALNPFVFTPTTTSLPPPDSMSPFAGPAPSGVISPLSSTSSGSSSDTSPSSATSLPSPALTATESDKQSRLRAKIANEILTSETNYVESLSTLLGCFIQPLAVSCRTR